MINENLGKLVQHARDKKPTDFKEILTSEIDSRIDAKVTEIRDGLSKNMFKENCEGHPDGVEHTHDDGTVHTHEGGDKEHTHNEVEEGTLPPALQKAIDAKKKGKGDDEDKDDKEKDEGTLPPALQKAIDAKKKKGKGDDEEEDEDKDPVGETKKEGTLPPALQKAIDAKKKNNSKSDDVDKSPEDDEDEDKKKDENIANFGDKKAKPFTDDDNPTDNKKKKDKKEDIRAVSRRILDKNPTGR
jgi:hypothetical protein